MYKSAGADLINFSNLSIDPYVTVQIVPQQQAHGSSEFTRTTRVKTNTQSPKWKETFTYASESINFGELVIAAYNRNHLLADELIGLARISLVDLFQIQSNNRAVATKFFEEWIQLRRDGKNTKSKVKIRINFEKELILENFNAAASGTLGGGGVLESKEDNYSVSDELEKCNARLDMYRTVREKAWEMVYGSDTLSSPRSSISEDSNESDMTEIQHRFVIKSIEFKNSNSKQYLSRLCFILRVAGHARKMSLSENLFCGNNYLCLEDFYVPELESNQVTSAKIEVWLRHEKGNEMSCIGHFYFDKRHCCDMRPILDAAAGNGNNGMDAKALQRHLNNPRFERIQDMMSPHSDKNMILRFAQVPVTLTCDSIVWNHEMNVIMAWTQQPGAERLLRHRRNVKILIPGIGVSLIDTSSNFNYSDGSRRKEILYVNMTDIDLLFQSSIEQKLVSFMMQNLNIDVQSYNAQYVCMLRPSLTKKNCSIVESADGDNGGNVNYRWRRVTPFMQLVCNMANIQDSPDLVVIQGLEILFQKILVNFEEEIMWQLIDFINILPRIHAEYAKHVKKKQSQKYVNFINNDVQCQSLDYYLTSTQGKHLEKEKKSRKYFVSFLCIYGISMEITICVDSNVTSHSKYVSKNDVTTDILVSLLKGFLHQIGGKINQAPIRLNSIKINNIFSNSFNYLFDSIMYHFLNQLKSETYKFIASTVGSMELIGNPINLVKNLGTGFADVFIEPASGLIESPQAFARGINRGVTSFATNVIGGIFDSASKVTSTVGSKVELLAFDKEYSAKRKELTSNKQNEPKHIGDGLLKGITGLGKGIFDGVTGVVTQPVNEIKQKGAAGIGSGIGKGLTGLVVKPVVGVVDLASGTLQGIANTTDYLDNNNLLIKRIMNQRVRIPRCCDDIAMQNVYQEEMISSNNGGVRGRLRQYNQFSALAKGILWGLGMKGILTNYERDEDMSEDTWRGSRLMHDIDLRLNERIYLCFLINNGQRLVVGTEYRLLVCKIVRTKKIREDAGDLQLYIKNIESIYWATYGQGRRSLNVTKELNQLLLINNVYNNYNDYKVLNLKAIEPFTEYFASVGSDPCPGVKKELTIDYYPSYIGNKALINEIDESYDRDLVPFLASSQHIESVGWDGNRANYERYVTVKFKHEERKKHIVCMNRDEARLLAKNLEKYLAMLFPKIEHAQLGFSKYSKNVKNEINGLMRNGKFRMLTNDIKPKYGKILLGKQVKRKSDQGMLLSDNLIIKYENEGSSKKIAKTKWFKDGTRVVL